MKTKTKYVSLVVAAAVAGVAFFALSKTSFSAFFQSDLAVAVVTAATIAGFTFRDYSRRVSPLAAPATVLRPTLRRGDRSSVRTTVYGAKSDRSERIAA
jgi:hypothetical protein